MAAAQGIAAVRSAPRGRSSAARSRAGAWQREGTHRQRRRRRRRRQPTLTAPAAGRREQRGAGAGNAPRTLDGAKRLYADTSAGLQERAARVALASRRASVGAPSVAATQSPRCRGGPAAAAASPPRRPTAAHGGPRRPAIAEAAWALRQASRGGQEENKLAQNHGRTSARQEGKSAVLSVRQVS